MLSALAASATLVGLTPTPPCWISPTGEIRGANAFVQIEQQWLSDALSDFAEQTHVDYAFSAPRYLARIPVRHLKGTYSFEFTLDYLFEGTGYTYRFVSECQFQIEPATRPATPEPEVAAASDTTPEQLPQVLVSGMLNADVRRTRNDVKPYDVIDSVQIKRATSGSFEGVLKQYSTTNVFSDAGQTGGVLVGRAPFNLRGFGANQTQVLINGRKISSPLFIGGGTVQPDTVPIPAAAIERIETLPASASGVYGGGAMGGIINIVLRDGCELLQLEGRYGSSYAADAESEQAFLTTCLRKAGTTFRVTGSYTKDAPLLTAQRDFTRKGRDRILETHPEFFYGQSPVGYTTNYRSRTNTPLNGDGSPTFGSVPVGHTLADGRGPLLANLGRYNLDLANTAQAGGGGRYVLQNGPVTHYANITLDQQLSERISFYADGTSSRNTTRRDDSLTQFARLVPITIPKGALNNPFDQDIIAVPAGVGADYPLVSRLAMYGVTTGFRFPLPWAPYAGIEYSSWVSTLRRDQFAASSVAPAVTDGPLNVFQDLNLAPLDIASSVYTTSFPSLKSRTRAITLRQGSVEVPGFSGNGTLSGALEYRKEVFAGGPELSADVPTAFYSRQQRKIFNGYAEALIPLRPHLDLYVAGRFDRYLVEAAEPLTLANAASPAPPTRVSFDSVNPTIGLQFWPVPQFGFRTTFGTAFLPPTGDQLATSAPGALKPEQAFHDVHRDGQLTGPVTLLAGGNRDLNPERSRSLSVGFITQSWLAEGLRTSVNYVRTVKRNQIVHLADFFEKDAALAERMYPSAFTRAAPEPGFSYGRITAIDLTERNGARALISALDVQLDFAMKTARFGEFSLWMRTTYQPTHKVWASYPSEPQRLAGVSGYAPKLVAVGGLTAKLSRWELTWNSRYLYSYLVEPDPLLIANQGRGGKVSSQIVHDASVAYCLPWDMMTLDVRLSAANVFDRSPAFDAGARAFASAQGDYRRGRYSLTVGTTF